MSLKTLGSIGVLSLATALPASAGVFNEVINLSGSTSDGVFGDGGNTVVVVNVDDGGTGQTVIGFAWVLSFQAFSPSWGSEARIDISSPLGTTFTFNGGAVGWGNSSGIFVDGGTTTAFDGEFIAGNWTFRFYESWDDAITPDGIYNSAYFIIAAVPAPGAMALLGLAGVMGLRGRRRA